MADIDLSVPGVIPVRHADPYAPVLLNSQAFTPSVEQTNAIRALLLLTSADTDFAQKCANALRIILGAGINGGVVPVLVSLEPATAPRNTNALKVKCKGTDFDMTSVIYINSNAMPTTFTSPTEVFTSINTGPTATTWPVLVRSGTGINSNTRTFTVT